MPMSRPWLAAVVISRAKSRMAWGHHRAGWRADSFKIARADSDQARRSSGSARVSG